MAKRSTLLSVLAVLGFHCAAVNAFAPFAQTSRFAKTAFIRSNSHLSAASSEYEFALLFDCDGGEFGVVAVGVAVT
jgi:hypothetical protein